MEISTESVIRHPLKKKQMEWAEYKLHNCVNTFQILNTILNCFETEFSFVTQVPNQTFIIAKVSSLKHLQVKLQRLSLKNFVTTTKEKQTANFTIHSLLILLYKMGTSGASRKKMPQPKKSKIKTTITILLSTASERCFKARLINYF